MAGLGFLSAIGREHREILAELTSRHAQSQIIDVAREVELEAYDTPAFHDRLVRAAAGGQFRPWQVVEGLTGLAGALIGIAGITLALLALEPWLVPLVLAAAVPLLVAVARGGELMFRFHHRTTEAERRRNYLYMLLSGKDAAKELRAFGLGDFLRERFDRLYDEHLVELRKVARRRLRVSLLGNLATTVGLAGIVAALLVLALNGRIGLADAGTAAGAVFVLGERLMNAVFSAGMLYESSLFIEDFTSFVAMAPGGRGPPAARPGPVRLPAAAGGGRQLHLPERHHPGGDERVHGDRRRRDRRPGRRERLGQDHPGQAAVPAVPAPRRPRALGRGRHRHRRPRRAAPLGGRHLPGLPPLLAAGRREHRHGPPPADRRHRGDPGAAVHAGADDFLAKLPAGYETVLGPEFEGGNELSVGQWQRVALARAFFRDAPFIILDEPTAALDARAEHELFESIRTLCRGRSVLLISHRFSSVRSADRIYVLDGGRVAESGSHDELMALGGRYAELFTLQASAYLSSSWPS